MKANTMAAESAAGAGLLWKLGVSLGAGLIGAAAMAAFDPPTTKKELFKQAAVAGTGSLVFGPVAAIAASKMQSLVEYGDLFLPVCFLVGALSWGAFGALAKLRRLVSEKAAAAVAKKAGL